MRRGEEKGCRWKENELTGGVTVGTGEGWTLAGWRRLSGDSVGRPLVSWDGGDWPEVTWTPWLTSLDSLRLWPHICLHEPRSL